MSKINLYKVIRVEELKEKLALYGTPHQHTPIVDELDVTHSVSLYYQSNFEETKELPWKWLLESFNIAPDEQVSRPKAVVLFESSMGCFVATFGHSYFLVNKHCDRDYPFSLARRIEFENIKTTTLNSQNTTRNRMIYSYLECTELEFESGEAYAKLKANAKLPEGFTLYKPSMQFGTSVSFITAEDSLDAIVAFICFAENTILKGPELHKIPVYSEIKREEDIQEEEVKLAEKLDSSSGSVIPMEIEIVGTTEVFQSDDYEYELIYRGSHTKTTELSSKVILQFMEDNSITPRSKLLDIQIILFKDGKSVSTQRVHDYIDWVNDESRCLLLQGKWYRFNDDFINYLHDSLEGIPAHYNEKYDLKEAEYTQFLKEKENEAGNVLSNEKLRQKYYNERYFNIIREQEGFKNYDRVSSTYAGNSYEACDLVGDDTIFAVKIGQGAEKLTYAITQSETSLRLNKSGQSKYSDDISKIGLWYVLERRTMLTTNEAGYPNLNDISSISLKIKLDQWKKNVLLAGYKPIIYINYKN